MVNKMQTLICGIMFAMNDVSILKKKQKKKHILKHPYIVWIYKMLVVTILFNRHGKTRANDFQDQ